MVRVRLKTKLVLAISGMVFVLVAIFCYVYISHRVRQSTTEANDRAGFVAKEIQESAREATQVDLRQLDVNVDDPATGPGRVGKSFAERQGTQHASANHSGVFKNHVRRRYRRCEWPRHRAHRSRCRWNATGAARELQRRCLRQLPSPTSNHLRRAASLRLLPAHSAWRRPAFREHPCRNLHLCSCKTKCSRS